MKLTTRKIMSFCFLVALFLGVQIVDVQAQGRDKKQHGPPSWAPAHGYRAKTRYVYFPDRNFYYDLQKGVYIYISKGDWEVSVKLPSFLYGYNMGTARKIELDFVGETPQKMNSDHMARYSVPKTDAKNKGAAKSSEKQGEGKKKQKKSN